MKMKIALKRQRGMIYHISYDYEQYQILIQISIKNRHKIIFNLEEN